MRFWLNCTSAICVALSASPALGAENIACMDNGYSADEQAVFDRYYSGFSQSSLDAENSSDMLVDPLSNRARDCALANGWTPDAIYSAVIYRMSAMLAHALELKTPLTREQMDRLEETLANTDQARLRAVLGPGIEASLKGEAGPDMSEDDKLFLGMIVVGAGLPLEQASSEFVGALLGARMMAQMAAEKFAAP